MTPDVDRIAAQLITFGRLGRSMPPAWRGAKVKHVVSGPEGQKIGHILPGEGLYLDLDPKALGITRGRLPHVFTRSKVRRLVDAAEKHAPKVLAAAGLLIDPVSAAFAAAGTITTYDGIIAARAGGKANDVFIAKNSITTTASDWFDMFRVAGLPAAGTYDTATPPTQAATDRTTTGAWSVGLFNPSGADRKYLLTFGWASAQQINAGVLVDTQVQGGAFRLTVTSAETVASPVTIPRQYYSPLGAGCYMTGVTTTAASATATNLTVTYLDQDGNSSSTTIAGPATATTNHALWPDSSTAVAAGPFWALASGDYGVRSVSQTQSSVALASGVLAVIIVTPLVVMPGIAASAWVERDSTVQIDGLTELVTASGVLGCLDLLVFANTTSTGTMTAFMRSCAG